MADRKGEPIYQSGYSRLNLPRVEPSYIPVVPIRDANGRVTWRKAEEGEKSWYITPNPAADADRWWPAGSPLDALKPKESP